MEGEGQGEGEGGGRGWRERVGETVGERAEGECGGSWERVES